ncbi:MAG TPA: hypothetical protein PK597_03995 [Oscillospiraceae bacterium]|nr:hypothetical protein [Oscillospiraceae bacterium]
MRNCRCRSCRSATAFPAAATAAATATAAAARSAGTIPTAAVRAAAAVDEPLCIHPSPLLAASTCPCLPPILLERLDAQDEVLTQILAAVRSCR